MSVLNNLSLILHRIRVRLYPNYLKNVKGAYIARTNNERTLDVEDICTASKTRGGFSGTLKDMFECVNWYLDETAYQLCDGYAVTNGYYTIHPNVGGTFDSVKEAHDHEKHPISFRFSARAKLHKLASEIAVEVEGIADAAGYIDTFVDYEEESTNGIYVPGNQFVIHGDKIKIAGSEPGIGVFFVPVDDPSRAVKMTRIAENSPSKITGIAPRTEHLQNRIEIRTQYSGTAGKPLKTMRTLTSSFILEEA
jgi:hypothetical protein